MLNHGRRVCCTRVVHGRRYCAEQAGVATGGLFGEYDYPPDRLGPKIGHVPLIVPFSWITVVYVVGRRDWQDWRGGGSYACGCRLPPHHCGCLQVLCPSHHERGD